MYPIKFLNGNQMPKNYDGPGIKIVRLQRSRSQERAGRQIILAGQHGDAGGGGTKESLYRELKKRNLSAPTIKCFGNGGLESRNVLQLLFTCWNLIQQFEWDEFKTLWTSCTGTPMQKRMDQPVLTRWEYVGKAIAWLAWKRKCYSCTSIIPKSLS